MDLLPGVGATIGAGFATAGKFVSDHSRVPGHLERKRLIWGVIGIQILLSLGFLAIVFIAVMGAETLVVAGYLFGEINAVFFIVLSFSLSLGRWHVVSLNSKHGAWQERQRMRIRRQGRSLDRYQEAYTAWLDDLWYLVQACAACPRCRGWRCRQLGQ